MDSDAAPIVVLNAGSRPKGTPVPAAITLIDENAQEVQAPAQWVVCPRCQGEGTHDAWTGGMTVAEMNERGPEFLEDYAAGMYAVACAECGGKRVIAVLDQARATVEQQRLYDEAQQEQAEERATRRAESAYYGDR